MVFDLRIPEKWEELSVSNILYIGKYWQSWQLMIVNKISLRKAKAMLFIELSGIKSKIRQKELMEALANIHPSTGVNVLDLTEFIFKDFELTKNLIPEIKLPNGIIYCGPSDKISNISIDEFTFAFSCYTQWHATNQEHYLDKLAGILYRPLSADFDVTGIKREPFNNNLIAKHEAVFRDLDDGYKNAIYLFFKSCMEFLNKKYDTVFNQKGESGSTSSFKDIVIEMSGDKFGTFEQTKQENLYIVLDELNRVILQNQKANRK